MAKYFFSLAEEAHYSVVVKVTLQISHGLVIIFQRQVPKVTCVKHFERQFQCFTTIKLSQLIVIIEITTVVSQYASSVHKFHSKIDVLLYYLQKSSGPHNFSTQKMFKFQGQFLFSKVRSTSSELLIYYLIESPRF